jgi:hypothetical protein
MENTNIPVEQKHYSSILRVFVLISMAVLFVGYFLYVSGLLPVRTEPETIAEKWNLSADEFREETEVKTGFGRLSEIMLGDGLSFSTLLLLAMGTMICFIPLGIIFIIKKDYVYAAIVVLQIAILVFAASGIVGGH